jgi:hypothetical protein
MSASTAPRLLRVAGKPNWFVGADGKRITTGTARRKEAELP